MKKSPQLLTLSTVTPQGERFEEQIWVNPTSDARWEVANAPFLLSGIAVGDILSVHKDGKFDIEHSGNSTAVIFLSPDDEVSHEKLPQDLLALGCEFETRNTVIAANVPYSHKDIVFALLDKEDATWDWYPAKEAKEVLEVEN